MKPKMGRPKVPKAKRRAIILNARLSPDEYKTIIAAVKRAGESTSEWVRKALLGVASGQQTEA